MALKSYQGVALDLLGQDEFVVVWTTGGTKITGTVAEASPSLLRLTSEVRDSGNDNPFYYVEHLINPYQITAITVRVAGA